MIVGDRYALRFRGELHLADEAVQPQRELRVGQGPLATVEQRVDDVLHEFGAVHWQRITLGVELVAAAVADQRQGNQLVGEHIGPFRIDEQYQVVSS